MRDARLNLIGEGANDVLRCFNAMVGLRNLGKELQARPQKAVAGRDSVAVAAANSRAAQHPAEAGRHARQADRPLRPRLHASASSTTAKASSTTSSCRPGSATLATELFHASCVYARLTGLL